MKTKYLDVKNCHELLPSNTGLSLISRLDECLNGINNLDGPLNGEIDNLIKQNEKTSGLKKGYKRLCSSPIEIMQVPDLQTQIINTQAVERSFAGPALLHTVLGYRFGIESKTTIPLQFILKKWGDASKDYQCYIHVISSRVRGMGNFNNLLKRELSDKDNYYYVGITGRNWLLRLDEHIREMLKGNRRVFYEKWREMTQSDDVLFSSFLRDINLSFEEAMDWEEKYVDKIASDAYGLNMIPGGFKGLKLLHKYRIIKNIDIDLDEREKAIYEYLKKHPRKGLPNPFISELWKDDDFYLKNIQARKKSLSTEQVRKIRDMVIQGKGSKQIYIEVKAFNERQVKNVIQGKTYRRIK